MEKSLLEQELAVGEDVVRTGQKLKSKHTHIIFTCPAIKPFWEERDRATKYILNIKDSLAPESCLGIDMKSKIKANYHELFDMMRLTALKKLTR